MDNGLWPSYWLIYQYMTSINYAPSFTWNYTTIDYMATNARTGGDVGGYDPSSYYAATFGPAINFAVGQPAAESSPGFQRGCKQDDYDWTMPPISRLTDTPGEIIRPDRGAMAGKDLRFYTDFGYIDLKEFRYMFDPAKDRNHPEWDFEGVYIALAFQSTVAPIYNYKWIQTVWTDYPISLDLSAPYNDPQFALDDPVDDQPFFYGDAYSTAYTNFRGYTSTFWDIPMKDKTRADMIFMGEVSLVINYGDCVTPIITFTYGWRQINGGFSFIDVHVTKPTLDHLRLFETPKTKINLLCPGYQP